MNNKYTFYFQENNTLFNGSVLSVCYKADENEISCFGLTGGNVLIILKSSKLLVNPPHQSVDFLNFEAQRRETMQAIAQYGDGIFIYLPQEG